MPELPEVETVRRGLEPELPGQRVAEAWGHPSSKFNSAGELVGAEIDDVRRRGKYLLFGLVDDRELIVHLGMTGQLTWHFAADDHLIDKYVRAWWLMEDGGRLQLRDVRRFGRVAVVDAGHYETLPTLHHLGPEPFDDGFTDVMFWAALKTSSRCIKTQLLSQRPIAGVGNIYADEACWVAQVSPISRRITKASASRLLAALRDVMGSAIDNGGTTLRDYRTVDGSSGDNQQHLLCYGRAGEPCLRCSKPLTSRVLDGRTTTWCRSCQPAR
ncbi:MAG: bifunctional DNA-formamidopyrimidine glycosylase/DNA-(apurinic or apyrimidinic site) lyase [Actinobacteria bacterium]|nr:bifunctional DNA-formamidopyrimidine glycosylase/DNA-(apurinic or apyrimidinic site) lyase [Actinomycetota bacterium]